MIKLMNEDKITREIIPEMSQEVFDILQQTLIWFDSSEQLPPSIRSVYGAVRRKVGPDMILTDSKATTYISLEIVYWNDLAKKFQDSNRQWCHVEKWSVLPDPQKLDR